jgi:site-specific recombinase XerD
MNLPVVTPVFNWRNKISKKGFYPIHLRVYINPDPYRYYPVKTPQRVRLEDWTGKEGGWVKNTHPFSFEINTRIAELKGKITDLTKRFYNQNKPIAFYAIEREIVRKGDRSLVNDYFRNYIKNPPETVTLDPVTWEKYEACLMHLDNFNPKLRFSDIDETMIARIKNYLADQKGRKGKLEGSTIKSYFNKLKIVLEHAAKKEHLLEPKAVEEYFQEITISESKRKEGLHLEIEEVQGLRKLTFLPSEQHLERVRDLFLFQVYTGFYYNDLQILKKTQLFKDIEYGYYIIGERDKNGNPTIIPLFKFSYANEIIEKYRDRNPENEFLFRKDVFVEIQNYNIHLKTLGKRASIIRPISNKTGRHTNAQMWIRFGADRPVLSKMMGHEKEQTTQNYYKVNLREIIEGTKAVNFGQFGI